MAVSVKDEKAVSLMREAGRITGEALNFLSDKIAAGISTFELDAMAENFIMKNGAVPSFKGYNGFPCSICASINEEIIHGIPDRSRILKEGDIISIDVGAYKDGFHGDAARTFAVGKISPDARRLIEVTKQSFFEGIKYASEGNYLRSISSAIQKHIEKNGFSVVRNYVGHGIGRNMHENPQIPNYFTIKKGPLLKKGMTLAIEPMATAGSYKVKIMKNKWTVSTLDGSLSAHYENTVLITDSEPEILTLVQ